MDLDQWKETFLRGLWLVDKAGGKSYYVDSPNQMWKSIDNILNRLEKQAGKEN